MGKFYIQNGEISGFDDDLSALKVKTSKSRTRRVSRVVPMERCKYLFFLLLRKLFKKDGKIKAWTRSWRGKWIVIIEKERFGPFSDRIEAIQFEKRKIHRDKHHLFFN